MPCSFRSLLDYHGGPGQISPWGPMKQGRSGGPGQTIKFWGVVKHASTRASAVVAVVIIAPISPTAASAARAITRNVVFWILSRFNILQNDI